MGRQVCRVGSLVSWWALPNNHTESLYTVPHSPRRQDERKSKLTLQTTMVTLLENPCMGLQQGTPEPQIIVIFGASGSYPASWFQRLQNEAGKTHSRKPLLWEWHVGTGATTTSTNTCGRASSSFLTGSAEDLWQTLPKVCSTAW